MNEEPSSSAARSVKKMLPEFKRKCRKIGRYLFGRQCETPLESWVHKATPDNLRDALANYNELEKEVANTNLEQLL